MSGLPNEGLEPVVVLTADQWASLTVFVEGQLDGHSLRPGSFRAEVDAAAATSSAKRRVDLDVARSRWIAPPRTAVVAIEVPVDATDSELFVAASEALQKERRQMSEAAKDAADPCGYAPRSQP